ncbi:hypothetical protein C8R43DRAFT_1244377 [Mycena crocata]|nr:hypothetical protein C8R43DRAFT_1244377 [Mycena crocata]
MHPALEWRNVARLPAKYQDLARAACAHSESADAAAASGIPMSLLVQEFALLWDKSDISQALLFLPVLHRILDPPESILDCTRLSDEAVERMCRNKSQITGAIKTLYCLEIPIRHSLIANDIRAELWARMWPWIVFQNRFLHVLRVGDPNLEVQGCCTHLSLLRHLAFDKRFEALDTMVHQTHDVRMLITRIWHRFVHDAALRQNQVAAGNLGDLLLAFMGISNTSDLKELIQGAGGTLFDLGSLVIKHLAVITSTAYTTLPMSTISALLRIICNDDHTVAETLVAQGLVKRLVPLLLAMQRAPRKTGDFISAVHELSYCTVSMCIRLPPGRSNAIAAVRSGLLGWIIGCASREHGNVKLMGQVVDVLPVLTGHLCYYSFVDAVRHQLEKLSEMELSSHLINSPFWHAWKQFADLARERLQVATEFDNTPSVIRFCDNLVCNVWADKQDTKRCAGCESRYYCSIPCQKADWKHGTSHKRFCKHLKPKGAPGLPTRDKSFLRHLVHANYMHNKLLILRMQMKHMLAMGSTSGYFTDFDYRHTPVRVSVHDTEELIDASRRECKTSATEMVERMRCSGGRFHIHRVTVPDGGEDRYWTFGLRTTSTEMYEGLQELVEMCGEGGMGEDIYVPMLEVLISADKADGKLVELHSY